MKHVSSNDENVDILVKSLLNHCLKPEPEASLLDVRIIMEDHIRNSPHEKSDSLVSALNPVTQGFPHYLIQFS